MDREELGFFTVLGLQCSPQQQLGCTGLGGRLGWRLELCSPSTGSTACVRLRRWSSTGAWKTFHQVRYRQRLLLAVLRLLWAKSHTSGHPRAEVTLCATARKLLLLPELWSVLAPL